MKTALTSLDIRRLARDLQSLVGLRIDGINLYPAGAYAFRFSRSKQRMVIDARGWVFLTEERSEGVEPDGLCQKLKKELSGLALASVEQVGFDRVMKLKFEGRELVIELFAGGNVILNDGTGLILAALRKREFKSRIIAPGQKYVLPSGVDPTRMSIDEIRNRIFASTSDTVSTLAVPLGMGAEVAREVCQRAGIDEHAVASGLTTPDIEHVFASFSAIIAQSDAGSSGYMDNEVFASIRLSNMEPVEERASLSDCISRFYLRFLEAVTRKDDGQEKVKRIATKQKAQIEAFEKRADECARIADLLYGHFEDLSRILNAIRESRGGVLPEGFERGKESTVTATIDGMKVQFDWKYDVNVNAARYYEEGKKFRSKAEGAKVAMEKAAVEQKKRMKLESPKKGRKTAWFEKFRWFVTSEGCLVIAGHNAKENELIVRRHMGSDDIYIHADIPGAPSTVIRGKCGEQSIREGCAFAVCFSRAWMLGLASADAFWVKGEQVSTHAPPGEFLARGSFLITGRKNFVRDLPLRLVLGTIEYESEKRFVCAPEGSFQAHSAGIVIAPGTTNREEFIRESARMLGLEIKSIERIVPGGNVAVVEIRGAK